MYDHSRISHTAKLVAYARQFSDIPFATEVAEETTAQAVVAAMFEGRGVGFEKIRYLAPIFEIRYKSMVAALRRSGIHQVVEFASGLSLRGLALTKDPSITYVETDLPGMSGEKQKLVAELCRRGLAATGTNLKFADVNLLNWDEVEAATSELDPSKPVAVIHEGLFQYLNFAEKEEAARNIRKVLERFGGCWLTPDLDTAEATARWQNVGGKEGSQMFAALQGAIVDSTERDFRHNAFRDDDHIREFFGKLGFALDVRPQWDDSFDVTSLAGLPMPAEVLDELRRYRLWTLTLANAS